MENVTTIQDKEPLIFTDSAAEKVKKLIEEEKNPALNLESSLQAVVVLVFNMDSHLMRKFRMVMLKLQNVELSFC